MKIPACLTQYDFLYSLVFSLGIGVRAYCDPDWYGSDCLTYCKAQTTDYYGCQVSSGAKICFQGWKGDYCTQDVDECTERVDVCQHDGSCTNTAGGFQCQCVEGITGKNCELVTNHCALNKCLNGGICNENERDFKCDFPWTGETCDLNVDITNITVLGVINHNNKGSLITGLRKVVNDLGGIQGQVNVVVSTHIYSESINITTQVQFYVTLENGTFLTSDFVREIFTSHSDTDINQHLPLPLYPARDTDDEEIGITTQENITEGSWFKSNWYKVVGALSAGLVLVALCVSFLMWRKKSHGSGQMLEDNQGNVIEMDVVNRTVQGQHRPTSGCEEDARASTDGYRRSGAAARHSSRQEVASYSQPFHDTRPDENRCSRLATPTPDNSNYATLGSCEKGSNDYTVIDDVNVDGATENLYEDVHF
ncbi:complement component C1q receptor-like [Haliotis rubra]|uniref:complement component C1q receptor-like n=1 Tax=Haliotis rubra TaxID=36100 RepID=UPI001EE54986|nr:complement component C1q receptor-like [Haliotis rubra]